MSLVSSSESSFSAQLCTAPCTANLCLDSSTSSNNSNSATTSAPIVLQFREDLDKDAQLEMYHRDIELRREANRLLAENSNNVMSILVADPTPAVHHQQRSPPEDYPCGDEASCPTSGGLNPLAAETQPPTKPVVVVMPQVSKITLSPSATVDATRWSLCALITESSRYHREATSKTGEERLFHLPEAAKMPPVAFGSAQMTDMLLNDTHKLFARHGCAMEEASHTSPLPAHLAGIDPLLLLPTTKNIGAATQACRKQLAQLDQWYIPSAAQKTYPSGGVEGSGSSSGGLSDNDDDGNNSSSNSLEHYLTSSSVTSSPMSPPEAAEQLSDELMGQE